MPEYSNDKTENFSPVCLLERDIPDCVGLAINNFDAFQHSPEHVEHWFKQRIINNPWQKYLPGIGVGIKHKHKLIAFRAMFAQPWWLGNTKTIIAFAAHTAVDHAHRGKGLATQMINESKKLAVITGSSTAGIITQKAYYKLGFNEIGGSDNNFFILRASFKGSFQNRLGKPVGNLLGRLFDYGMMLRELNNKPKDKFCLIEEYRCGVEFDHFWENSKGGYASCLERSSDYLNWRIFDYPTCPLHLTSLKDSSGALRGYGIWHVSKISECITMAVLRDIFYLIEDEAAVRALLYLLIKKWRDSGISWISLEVASPQLTAIFYTLGYEHVPSHGNRYQIASEPTIDHNILKNWYRSGLDGDYFDLKLVE